MKSSAERAEILVEALPYIEAFHGRTVVVKYGGSVAREDLTNFVRDLILMKYVGIKPVVVHGGGPQIQEHLDMLGIKSDFIAGLRVTNRQVMEVVEMVLVGKINQQIVTSINRHQMETVGLSGKEGKLIKAKKFDLHKFAADHSIDIPQDADLGYVGEVLEINPEIIRVLEGRDVIPIIAPIGWGEDGTTYNINVDGILDKKGKLISSVTKRQARKFIRNGTINSGMIPKVMCALEALEEGVNKVHIINGTIKRALILELLTDLGIGTEITL
jgi:acetylglutamate kinase